MLTTAPDTARSMSVAEVTVKYHSPNEIVQPVSGPTFQ